MSSLSGDQDNEVTYISGVTPQGTVAPQSFWTWNRDTPATYSATLSYEAKWGPATAGTGAAITYAFDAGSHWSATEKQAFVSAMHLWSDVANITFSEASASSAQVTLSRAHDGTASAGISSLYAGDEGSTTLGTAIKGGVAIDTSVAGFGPLGGSLSSYGGYPWTTLEHEIGHVLGLGHSGAYDEDVSGSDSVTNGAYDNQAYTLMSYHDASTADLYPTTPMLLDIAAEQRLYGIPTASPLSSGGQVFGFHSNITGDTAQFYDFTINTTPDITIWDGGANNTLDLSGFSASSTVSLVDGTSNSVDGNLHNLGIAFGTRIDTAIGGSGDDTISGNADGDVIMGGAGVDSLTGGAGNDHIYGNSRTSAQGAPDDTDYISGGGGNDYVNGNAGSDHITMTSGDNRIYGGAGDDVIYASNGNDHINGNLGNDQINVMNGNNTVLGGQGDDTFNLFTGNNVVSGDMGDDHINVVSNAGYVLLTGGGGSDTFSFGAAPLDRPGALQGYVDEITDFQIGTDKVNLEIDDDPLRDPAVLHDPGSATYASVAGGRAAAQALFDAHAGTAEVAAIQVGSDTYLFFASTTSSDAIDQAIRLDGVRAGDFTATSLTHQS